MTMVRRRRLQHVPIDCVVMISRHHAIIIISSAQRIRGSAAKFSLPKIFMMRKIEDI